MSSRVQIPMKPATAPVHAIAAADSVQSLKPASSGILQRKCACGGTASSGDGCEDCKKTRSMLQRSSTGQDPAIAPPIVHEVLGSPGQPLDQQKRSFFGPRFGHDFSKVRLHSDRLSAKFVQTNFLDDALAETLPPSLVQEKTTSPILQRAPASPEGAANRIHNLDLQVRSKPSGTTGKADPENPGAFKITINAPLTVDATALISAGQDCKDISFAWIQLCRPYYVHRTIYQSKTGGDDLEVNPTAKIQAKMPVLDVPNVGDNFSKRIPVFCADPEPDKSASARLSDRPASFHMISMDSDHFLAGVVYKAFFFDTLTMVKAGQAPQHLKSFYWDIYHCEEFGPPPAGALPGTLGPSLRKTSAVPVGGFIDGAPNEPGLDKMGKPADKICRVEANNEIQAGQSKPNKGKFNTGC